jgi:hypothetical protein
VLPLILYKAVAYGHKSCRLWTPEVRLLPTTQRMMLWAFSSTAVSCTERFAECNGVVFLSLHFFLPVSQVPLCWCALVRIAPLLSVTSLLRMSVFLGYLFPGDWLCVGWVGLVDPRKCMGLTCCVCNGAES